MDGDVGASPHGPPESRVSIQYDWTAEASGGGGGDPLRGIPSRRDFVLQDDVGKKEHHRISKALSNGGQILFQPWDVHESIRFVRTPGAFGSTQQYQINFLGHLSDGSSARIVINDAPVYFGVWFPEGDDSPQFILTITVLLREFGLTKHELGEGYPLRGYREFPRRYVKVFFSGLKDRREAIKTSRANRFETFSDDRSNYFRMLSRENFLPLCSWIAVDKYDYAVGGGGGRPCPCSYCGNTPLDESSPLASHVLTASLANIRGLINPLHPDNTIEQIITKTPLLSRERAVILTFDIETYSPDKGLGTPPDASKHNDIVFMLCVSAHWRSDAQALARVCLTTIPAAADSRWATVICGSGRGSVGDQASLIMAFAKIVRLWAPQVITGFNDGQYDWPFVVEKANQLGILVPMFETMSAVRRKNLKAEDVLKWNYQTDRPIKISADKRHFVSVLKAPGYIPVDARVSYMQLYPKSPKSSLKYFLGRVGLGGKADMPYTHMWKIFENAVAYYSPELAATGQTVLTPAVLERIEQDSNHTPEKILEEMRHVAHYCVIDAVRCQEMLLKRNVIQNNREVGNYSFTCFNDCVFYAGGHKVCNMLFAYAADSGVNHGRPIFGSMIAEREQIEGKYPGAFVVPPEKGLEEDSPVTGLDYASLYPSLIRTYNFSLEMYLSSEEEANYYESRGEKVHRVSFPFGGREVKGWFIQHQNRPEKIGLFPRALADLFNKRNAMKAVLKPLEANIEQFQSLINNYRKSYLDDASGFQAYAEADLASIHEAITTTNALVDKAKSKKKAKLQKKAKKLEGRARELKKFLDTVAGTATSDGALSALEKLLEELEFTLVGIDSKQKAVKVFMNTFYGEAGNKLSPLFFLALAGGVTSAGQYNLKLVKSFVEGLGFRVKYGDTDSLYLCCPPECYDAAEAEYEAALNALGIVTPEDAGINLWNEARSLILKKIVANSMGFDKLINLVAENATAAGQPVTATHACSPEFAQAYPELGAIVADGQKRLREAVSHLRERENSLGPRPQHADRLWLQRIFDESQVGGVEVSVRAAYEVLCVQKVEITMREMEDLRDKVNAYLKIDNGGTILKMAYEEVCFPSTWTGKKKYFAIAHQEQPNFHIREADDIFVRGIDIVKQGQTRLAVEIGQQCMWEATRLCPPGTRVTLIERVIGVLRKTCTDIDSFQVNGPGTGTWSFSDFIQSDAWKPDKNNQPVQRFMKRMAIRHRLQLQENVSRVAQGLPPNELDYIPPEPGSRFDYLLVNTPREFDLRGYARPGGKKGDLMEYVDVAKKRNRRINVKYYLTNYVVGLCARFINYEERFAHPDMARAIVLGQPIEYKTLDEYSQKAAKRYLTKLLDSFSGGNGGDDQKRGRSYKRAYAAASRLASEVLRKDLGDSADLLLGSNDLGGPKADATKEKLDFELFLSDPSEAESEVEYITLPLSERFRIIAAEEANAYFTWLEEEHNYTQILIKGAGIDTTPAGRKQLYCFLANWQMPSRRALLKNAGPFTHPAVHFDQALALIEYEAFLRLEELEPIVVQVAERLQSTLEELVAMERELEHRQNGFTDGELAGLGVEIIEANVEKTASVLITTSDEKRALHEMFGCWTRLSAVTVQRLIRARVVDRLHSLRDRAL